MTARRWLPAAAVAVFAAWLTWMNRGERVAVDVGLVTFYRAPLTVVLFVAFVAGMLSMLALSYRHDLRLREELRARGLLDAPAAPRTPEPARPEPADAGGAPGEAVAAEDDDRTWGAPGSWEAPRDDERTEIHPPYGRDPAR